MAWLSVTIESAEQLAELAAKSAEYRKSIADITFVNCEFWTVSDLEPTVFALNNTANAGHPIPASVKHLHLEECNDCPILDGHANLEQLLMTDCGDLRMTTPCQLPNLQSVIITQCMITEMPAAASCAATVHVEMCTQLASLVIADTAKLKSLAIIGCGQQDLAWLGQAQSLEELIVSGIPEVSVPRIRSLLSVTVIYANTVKMALMPSLANVSLRNISDMIELPKVAKTLDRLKIDSCPRLESVDVTFRETKSGAIEMCPRLKSVPIELLENPMFVLGSGLMAPQAESREKVVGIKKAMDAIGIAIHAEIYSKLFTYSV